MAILNFNSSATKEFNDGDPAFGVEDTVFITGRAYAKTPEAYASLIAKAAELGYEEKKISPEDKTREDEIFMGLPNLQQAECGSCESLISVKGVMGHNHPCECCGEPTYVEYTKDGAVELQFMDHEDRNGHRRRIGNTMGFRIFEAREAANSGLDLVLHAEPLLDRYVPPHQKFGKLLRPDVQYADEARSIMKEAAHLYRRETITDQKTGEQTPVIIINLPEPGFVTPDTPVNIHNTAGDIQNHRIVQVFRGKIYDQFETLPIPEYFEISSRYAHGRKHSLAEPDIHSTILFAAGQTDRADYYYQDGRTAFYENSLRRMDAFVRNFVDVDQDKWAEFLDAAPKDGPGFIYSLAGWAAKMSDGVPRAVIDEPNIGNALAGAAKLLGGQTLSLQEAVAMMDGMATPQAEMLTQALQEKITERTQHTTKGILSRVMDAVRGAVTPGGKPKPGAPAQNGPEADEHKPEI